MRIPLLHFSTILNNAPLSVKLKNTVDNNNSLFPQVLKIRIHVHEKFNHPMVIESSLHQKISICRENFFQMLITFVWMFSGQLIYFITQSKFNLPVLMKIMMSSKHVSHYLRFFFIWILAIKPNWKTLHLFLLERNSQNFPMLGISDKSYRK